MDDDGISDVCDLLGMSSIFNKEETNDNINTKDAEREFIKKSLDVKIEDEDDLLSYNPISEYNNIIKDLELDSNKKTTAIIEDEISFDDIHLNNVYKSNNDDDSFASKLTEEQTNQKIVDSVLSFDSDVKSDKTFNFNIDDENREDMKLTLLEKIDNLIEELEDDGVNIDKIPKVDFTSDLEKIEYVAKLLMLKANRNRYGNMGEEFILALANGLEMFCNGKRKFLGLSPDLTGCSDVVKVKLRRRRNDTCQVVSNVVEKYEVSPLMSLILDIVPAVFLHSRRRSSQTYDNLYTDLSDDITEIRKYSN